jgi:hypothetical protein
MAFKLIEAAQDRWRAVNEPHFVALVRVGGRLKDRHPQVLTIARKLLHAIR